MQLHAGVCGQNGGERSDNRHSTETPGRDFSLSGILDGADEQRHEIRGLRICCRGTRRPGPKFSKFGKRIFKMRCLGRGACVPVASAPHPFP